VPGPVCTADCRQGCKCQDGFSRSGEDCIPNSQCGSDACGVNQEWTDCSSSSCFESSCVNGKVVVPGPVCTADCRQGCKCQNGFSRSGQDCISNSQCGSNSRCGVNEEWTDCSSSSCFEPSCVNGEVMVPGPVCTADCRQGCRCQTGFARSGQNCISNTQCGAGGSVCTAFSDCGSCVNGGCQWQGSCQRACLGISAVACTTVALSCPGLPQPVCDLNEEWTVCSSSSCFESSCVKGKVVVPGPICTMDCRQGCRCSSGFSRRGNNCIRNSRCGSKPKKGGKKAKKAKNATAANGST